MEEKKLNAIGLVFTVEGRCVARGTVFTEDGQTLEKSLSQEPLRRGSVYYGEGGVQLPVNRACAASFEGQGEYWLTFAPERFLLREVPALEEEPQKKQSQKR